MFDHSDQGVITQSLFWHFVPKKFVLHVQRPSLSQMGPCEPRGSQLHGAQTVDANMEHVSDEYNRKTVITTKQIYFKAILRLLIYTCLV